MGSSCEIILDKSTHIEDVLTVMSGLLGYGVERRVMGREWWCAVSSRAAGAPTTAPIRTMPGVVEIEWSNAPIRREGMGSGGSVLYNFESNDGSKSMHPPSTQFWIALGTRLVKIFGGQVIHSDTAARPVRSKKYKARFARKDDNKVFSLLQTAIEAEPPLSPNEISAVRGASYSRDKITMGVQ